MKTRGVHSRKAYLWEFKYLVCIYLRETQWLTGKHICGSSSICCVCYLSLFFEKVVLCVVCSIVLLCVVLSKGSNGFPRGTSCMRVGGKVVLCVVFVVCCVVLCVGLLIVKHQCLACIVMVTTTEVIMNTPSS